MEDEREGGGGETELVKGEVSEEREGETEDEGIQRWKEGLNKEWDGEFR